MIIRNRLSQLEAALDRSPAVVLTGPRQVGKTTLALDVGNNRNAVYLDLERPADLLKVQNFEPFCEANRDRLIILDEVQRAPEIFALLRGIIDARRRSGQKYGQFLLLGSASLELLRQSSESLAGRIAQIELQPFDLSEIPYSEFQKLLLRGGFPESFLAGSDTQSFEWRQDFLRTYLERDIPHFGGRIAAETLRRFWTMLAHIHGQIFNASLISRGLDLSSPTISRYLDLMVDLLLVRRLQPWSANLGKRLIKSPKIYIRDCGLCHALLGVQEPNNLLGHPVVGLSFEGLVIETIAALMPNGSSLNFYRTASGAEIDLLVSQASGELWAIEIKYSNAPRLSKGFHQGCEDLKPRRKIVIHSGEGNFALKGEIEALSIQSIGRLFEARM